MFRPHKALPRSAVLEKHPVRPVGGAERGKEAMRGARNRLIELIPKMGFSGIDDGRPDGLIEPSRKAPPA